MPLTILGTNYNYDNTKNITYKGNEVHYVNFEPNFYIESTTGSIKTEDGNYQRNVNVQLYAGADSIILKNLNASSPCVFGILSYNSSTGVAIVPVISTLPNVYFTFNLKAKYLNLWVKPYTLTINVDEGISDWSVYRGKSYVGSLTNLYDGDRIYQNDYLYPDAEIEDTENYRLKENYVTQEIIVNGETTINLRTSKKITQTISGKTDKIPISINGITQYLARGKIEVGLGVSDISITGINNTYSYNEVTGTLSYTIYGFKANQNVSATITYWT